MTEYEFDKITLDVAQRFEVDVDDILEAFHEGNLKFYESREEAFHDLNMNHTHVMKDLFMLTETDLEDYDDALHYYLAQDDRLYLHDDGKKVVRYYGE